MFNYRQDILVQAACTRTVPYHQELAESLFELRQGCLAKNLLDSLNHTLCDVDILLSSQRADTLELVWSL